MGDQLLCFRAPKKKLSTSQPDEISKLKASNSQLTAQLIQKDLEIGNLTMVNEQLIMSQEGKNKIIKEYCNESIALKSQAAQLRREAANKDAYILKLKAKLQHYKVLANRDLMSQKLRMCKNDEQNKEGKCDVTTLTNIIVGNSENKTEDQIKPTHYYKASGSSFTNLKAVDLKQSLDTVTARNSLVK